MDNGIDPSIEALSLASLDIGPRKAIGYLPLYTIKRFLKRDPRELVQELRARGFSARIFNTKECRIKSGALYAWDDAGVKRAIMRYTHQREDEIDTDVFVENIAKEQFEAHFYVMPLVRECFGENRSLGNPAMPTPEEQQEKLKEWQRLLRALRAAADISSREEGWMRNDCMILGGDPDAPETENGDVGFDALSQVDIVLLEEAIEPHVLGFCRNVIAKFPRWAISVVVDGARMEFVPGTQWFLPEDPA